LRNSLIENRRTKRHVARRDMAPGTRRFLKKVIRIQSEMQKWRG